MIDHLRRVSIKAAWARPILYLATLLSSIFFGWILLTQAGNQEDVLLIPSLTATLWFLFSSLLISFFPHVPRKAAQEQKLGQRMKTKAVRIGYHIAAWTLLLLSVVLLVLTTKLLLVWMDTPQM